MTPSAATSRPQRAMVRTLAAGLLVLGCSAGCRSYFARGYEYQGGCVYACVVSGLPFASEDREIEFLLRRLERTVPEPSRAELADEHSKLKAGRAEAHESNRANSTSPTPKSSLALLNKLRDCDEAYLVLRTLADCRECPALPDRATALSRNDAIREGVRTIREKAAATIPNLAHAPK